MSETLQQARTPVSLEEIVDFCHRLQRESMGLLRAKRNLQEHRAVLVTICRQCRDETCPSGCEVKKAYGLMR